MPLHKPRLTVYTLHSEKYVETFAIWLAKIYNVVSRIPKWLFLVASGSIGSLLIQAMHSWGRKKEKKPKRFVVKPASAVPPPPVANAPAANAPAANAPAANTPVTTPDNATPAKTRSEGSPSGGRRRKTRK